MIRVRNAYGDDHDHPKGTTFKFDSDGDLMIFDGDRVCIAAHYRGTWAFVELVDEEEQA